jgi:L-fuconolactonase
LTVVLEHLAGSKGDEEPPYPLFRRAMDLAQRPNTYLKVPGLGEITSRPPVLGSEFCPEEAPPLIEIALDAFGPQRMMWGSDYPPVSNREGYRNALRGIRDYPALIDGEDREWVLAKTALGVFRFE